MAVYFLHAPTVPAIKIGYSGLNAENRFRAVRAMSPVPIELLAIWRDGSKFDERSLHSFFKADRMHGEWFKPSQCLLDTIEEYKLKEHDHFNNWVALHINKHYHGTYADYLLGVEV